jgi:uncharacterized protein (DUF58 family)
MPERENILDPDAIARGESLGLMARSVVEGYRVGEHRSPLRGFAIEFAQHREYTMGDDLRHLDWKVLGKTDRYYLKQYEQDTNYSAHIVVDGSESMSYGSGALTKFQYAKVLAACLSYLILQQRDAVTLHLVDKTIRETVPRTDSPGRIHHLMHRLAAFQATENTGLGNVLGLLSQMIKMRGIIILISDFFDDEERIEKGISQLRFGGSEVIVCHVLDPFEMEFPFDGTVEFIGLENMGRYKTAPLEMKKGYLEAFEKFRRRLHGICDRTGCHYLLANTGKSLAETLSAYLIFRQRSNLR